MQVYANGRWRETAELSVYANGRWRTASAVEIFTRGDWQESTNIVPPDNQYVQDVTRVVRITLRTAREGLNDVLALTSDFFLTPGPYTNARVTGVTLVEGASLITSFGVSVRSDGRILVVGNTPSLLPNLPQTARVLFEFSATHSPSGVDETAVADIRINFEIITSSS